MLKYRCDVVPLLKEKGYSSYRVRKEHLLAESVMQNLREHKPIDWISLETICRLLDCQPGDLIYYERETIE